MRRYMIDFPGVRDLRFRTYQRAVETASKYYLSATYVKEIRS